MARRRTRRRTPDGMASRPGLGMLDDPAIRNELAVPAQDRGRGDKQTEAASRREQAGEGGDDSSVSPADPGPCDAATQHLQLVTQDQDLDLPRPVGAREQDPPAEERGEHQGDHSQSHGRIMPSSVGDDVAGDRREPSFGHSHRRDPVSVGAPRDELHGFRRRHRDPLDQGREARSPELVMAAPQDGAGPAR